MKKFFVVILLVALSSCTFFKKKKPTEADIIARVNNEYLYASDILQITKGLKSEDSLRALKSYAESWVKKKMLLQKALDNIPENDVSIAKKVENYRESLFLYEYEKALINQKLDTAVKQPELEEWYAKLKNNFLLSQDVYLLFFIKLKPNAPQINEARKWILKPKSDEDRLKIDGYCKEFALSYVTNNGIWYEQENILKNFPLNQNDINALAAVKSYKEFKATDALWFIKIMDITKKGDPAPLQLISDKIIKAIIEKRRIQLVERTYNKIYLDGLNSKTCEVLVK